MDWQSYEELVKSIYECLGEQQDVSVVGWGATCRVQGKSGVSHQIDVLTSHIDGIASFRTAVECKYWNDKVGQDVVLKMIAILADTDIDKGVIVSKSGFTEPAKTLASQSGIGLLELREPVDEDWGNQFRRVSISLHYYSPRPYDLKFSVKRDEGSADFAKSFVGNLICTDDTFVVYPEGASISIYDLFVEENRNSCPEKEECLHEIEFPQGSRLWINDKSAEVELMSFKREHTVYESEIHIDAADAVWMILRDVFGSRRHAISPQGEMHEWHE